VLAYLDSGSGSLSVSLLTFAVTVLWIGGIVAASVAVSRSGRSLRWLLAAPVPLVNLAVAFAFARPRGTR
jgi:hypothetical protein